MLVVSPKRRARRSVLVCAVVGCLSFVAAACGSSGPAPGTGQATGGGSQSTASFAEFVGSVPNWILPITTPTHDGSPNTEEFSYFMWRPLYWEGTGTSPVVNESISLAQKPVYSDGNKVVTVDLKNYEWSDGQPVTARDVEFFFNLVKYDPADWSNYVTGDIPDNVKSFTIVNNTTFRLDLTKTVSPEWFSSDQLTLLTPMPQQVWDKTSSGGQIGNYDETASGAKDVMSYLMKQAASESTYASNPLWNVVDGPWQLTGFTSTGNISFKANPKYSGPIKPSLKSFVEKPYTSDTSEFNALLAGQVTYGYIPFTDLKEMSRVESLGYHPEAWNLWGINFIAINYDNSTTGSIAKQLYVRQALESLIDQPQIIKSIFNGEGTPDFAAIPTEPSNPYSNVKSNPNPYDPSRAVSLLRTHGWTVKPNGKTVCTNPGTNASECGAGIKSGQALAFTVVVNSGNSPVDNEMQALKSTWSQAAGIDLTVDPQPFTQVISDAFASCTASSPSACPWEMADWGGGEDLLPYPTGDQIFSSGGASNASHYANSEVDQLITTTHVSGSSALSTYNSNLSSQVPLIWVPNLSYQVSMISNKLKGANEQNPYTAITPENWSE